jgi:hypothetical protein
MGFFWLTRDLRGGLPKLVSPNPQTRPTPHIERHIDKQVVTYLSAFMLPKQKTIMPHLVCRMSIPLRNEIVINRNKRERNEMIIPTI